MTVVSPQSVRSRSAVRVAGAVCLVAALVAWAWTLTELTPYMSRMNDLAPMPDGDGEEFMWVSELRWGALLLAALGLVTATVTSRQAPRVGVALACALVVADAVIANNDPASKLLPALVVGAVAVAGAWSAAVWPVGSSHGENVDVPRRLAVVGVVGVACGPILLAQGTPAVNHPFLPATMGATTALLIGLLTALGATAALAARPERSQPLVVGGGIVAALPFAVLGLCTGWGVEPNFTMIGATAAPTLALIAYLVARPRQRPSNPPNRVRAISLVFAVIVAIAGSALSLTVLAMISLPPASILFGIGAGDYPADGISVLPGAVALSLLAGTMATKPSRTP
jgi:hypothetical protein